MATSNANWSDTGCIDYNIYYKIGFPVIFIN